MRSLEDLKATIEGTKSLGSIVRTMKVLAAVGVRQCDRAAIGLADYRRTVELGLRAVLREDDPELGSQGEGKGWVDAIVVGTDLGMCGKFNERVAECARENLSPSDRSRIRILAIGERVATRLEDRDLAATDRLPIPASVSAGIPSVIRRALAWIDQGRAAREGGRVLVFRNVLTGRGMEYEPGRIGLLPPDAEFLRRIMEGGWRVRAIPTFLMERSELKRALIRELVHAFLYGALIESLASENAARLESMEAAERHVGEHLEELRAEFNDVRQEAITAELLDIIAGVLAAGGVRSGARSVAGHGTGRSLPSRGQSPEALKL
jgi:F-type H+-transporting ATPase subunit gamma